MLQKLYISNYAIIQELTVEFSDGLNIITGETGAGKSIIMGALGLILGDRAESNALMNKENKCVVEGYFRVQANEGIKNFLLGHELDIDEVLLVRREIAVNGKSRAFVNDTPVNLSQLKELSALLVDLHQQFDTLQLANDDLQRSFLDALAENQELLTQYSQHYKHYRGVQKELEILLQQQKDQAATLDYNKFLFDELAELALKQNELELLDAELKLLSHAEDVKQELTGVQFELKESEMPLTQQLKILAGRLSHLKQYHESAAALGDRLYGVQVDLNDIAESIDELNAAIQYDPERMQLVSDRISAGYRLMKKHGVNSTNELINIQEALQKKLDDVLSIDHEILNKKNEAQAALSICEQLASKISANRQAATKPFTAKVNALLHEVGMPNAAITISMEKEGLGQYGFDRILYLFDANKTGRYEPLDKVASGGELSRLMLCIKSVVASRLQLPTLIFDEIDTGISGEAAKQVGIIMKSMSGEHQLISITHQPQIAARATAHYFVYKNKTGAGINTAIRRLTTAERIEAIARMIGGEKPSAAALQNAKEMIA